MQSVMAALLLFLLQYMRFSAVERLACATKKRISECIGTSKNDINIVFVRFAL